mmetsp:Transcript_79540/g.233851  ORF Transcript_79540/g.233851 Transcript_79540/m.233851 type:complete len:425 (-) Transcript_79540:182-1456(-)
MGQLQRHQGRHSRSVHPFMAGSVGMATVRLPMALAALLAAPAASRFSRQDFAPGEEACEVSLGMSGLPRARCIRRRDLRATLPVWNASLDFRFGLLSEEQFNSLLHTYSAWWGGMGDLPYNASRHYFLTDLLPPHVQALQGFVFAAEERPRPSGPRFPYPADSIYHTYNNTILVPNCWSTVYEVLCFAAARRAGVPPSAAGIPFFVYATGDQPIISWLDNATEHVSGPEDALGLPSTRQPGDIVLVWIDEPWRTRRRLVHTLLLVDPNLVFEKAGSGDTTPYRLIDLVTVHKAWDPQLFKYEVRRPWLGPETIEGPVARFSIAGSTPSSLWPEFWSWPAELQRRFVLGVADNDDGSIGCITLLEIEEHCLRYNGCRWELAMPSPKSADKAVFDADLSANGVAVAKARTQPLSAGGATSAGTVVV